MKKKDISTETNSKKSTRAYLYKKFPDVDYRELNLSRHTLEILKYRLGSETKLGAYTMLTLVYKCNKFDHISIMELEEKTGINK